MSRLAWPTMLLDASCISSNAVAPLACLYTNMSGLAPCVDYMQCPLVQGIVLGPSTPPPRRPVEEEIR